MLYGMSYGLLLEEEAPEIELLLWFDGLEDYVHHAMPLDQNLKMQMMHSAERCLKAQGIDCWIVTHGTSTLLHFKFDSDKLGKEVTGRISVDPFAALQSAMLLEYIYNDPWLLPLMRVVIKWGRLTDFILTAKDAPMDSLTLCFMVVDFCLKKKNGYRAIQHIVNPAEVNPYLTATLMSIFRLWQP